MVCVIGLLGLLLLILEVFHVYFLHTKDLVLLVYDAKLASICLILINISISCQNTVSLTMLNFNLSSISILVANDLLNLSILKISSLSLGAFLPYSLYGCNNLIRIFVLHHLFGFGTQFSFVYL